MCSDGRRPSSMATARASIGAFAISIYIYLQVLAISFNFQGLAPSGSKVCSFSLPPITTSIQ
jgi:hypothetical protein